MPTNETLTAVHASVYNKLADKYAGREDHSRHWILKSMGEHLLPRLGPRSVTLDVGCGVGVATELMAQAGHDAMGIDVSPKMIELCRSQRTAGYFVVTDYLHFHPMPLDAIVAFAFLHLWPKAQVGPVIAKLWHDLKPGGYIYVGTTVDPHSGDNWEVKRDYYAQGEESIEYTRWRARYVAGEFLSMMQGWAHWEVIEADNRFVDDFGKEWGDVLLRKVSA